MICPAAPTCPHVRNHKGKPKKAKCGWWNNEDAEGKRPLWDGCPYRKEQGK